MHIVLEKGTGKKINLTASSHDKVLEEVMFQWELRRKEGILGREQQIAQEQNIPHFLCKQLT